MTDDTNATTDDADGESKQNEPIDEEPNRNDATDDDQDADRDRRRRQTPGEGRSPTAEPIEPDAPEEFGLVQLFWGNGKGKTTAAMGMGFRAAGHGYRVHMLQFMKGGASSVEPRRGEYIVYAANRELIDRGAVVDLVETKPDGLELVLTGGHEEPAYLLEAADLVTEVRKEKHPFDAGQRARKGTEF